MKKIIGITFLIIVCISLVGVGFLFLDKGENNVVTNTKIPEDKNLSKEEAVPRMVRIEGVLYVDTGKESTVTRTCGTADGTITSTVERKEKPNQNNQSNFGLGYSYYARESIDDYDVLIDGKIIVFERKKEEPVLRGSVSTPCCVEYAYNIADPSELTERYENIAIIKIDSIDGYSNYNHVINEYVRAYTYGKATVMKNIKGKMEEEKFTYVRGGGWITLEEEINGDIGGKQEIRIDSHKKSKFKDIPLNQILIASDYYSDIEVEEGKTYLAFMGQNNDGATKKETQYGICGTNYGFREVEKKEDFSNLTLEELKNIKVKDNDSNSWVNLSEVIDFQKLK